MSASLTILHNLVLHNPNSNPDSLPCKLLLKILASLQNPENSKSLVHAEDINGMTALHYAAFQGNHQYCSILLAYYTNVRQNRIEMNVVVQRKSIINESMILATYF